jgi:hypothetical protein
MITSDKRAGRTSKTTIIVALCSINSTATEGRSMKKAPPVSPDEALSLGSAYSALALRPRDQIRL